jgi:hypothetical protein
LDAHKILVVTASSIDDPVNHVEQTAKPDFYRAELTPRLPPRLEAKIPKMFAWQKKPGYDFYLWLDGNISLARPDAIEYLLREIEGHDIVVIRHHRRPNIRQEVRYLRKGLREQSIYLISRYKDELWKEQYDEICRDRDYVDDLLVIGGIFLYRNTPQVQAMLKEWFYHVSRYSVQDQISFPYVLKKSGIRIKVLDYDYTKWDMIKQERHKQRDT